MKTIFKTAALVTLFMITSCAHHSGCKSCGSEQCDMHKEGKKDQCKMHKEEKKETNTTAESTKK